MKITHLSTSDPLKKGMVDPATLVRERTVDMLREAIVSQELKPGQRLVEREFIDRLGISRTTFREALRELASEGLITSIAQKGARVSSPTYQDVADLYEVRAMLGKMIVRKFVQNASDVEIKELAQSLDDYEKVIAETSDVMSLLLASAKFHQILIDGAQSPALAQLIIGVRSRTQIFRTRTISLPGRVTYIAQKFHEILEAIQRHDAELASNLYSEQITNAGHIALAGFHHEMASNLA